jgi:hypothetical protein
VVSSSDPGRSGARRSCGDDPARERDPRQAIAGAAPEPDCAGHSGEPDGGLARGDRPCAREAVDDDGPRRVERGCRADQCEKRDEQRLMENRREFYAVASENGPRRTQFVVAPELIVRVAVEVVARDRIELSTLRFSVEKKEATWGSPTRLPPFLLGFCQTPNRLRPPRPATDCHPFVTQTEITLPGVSHSRSDGNRRAA